MSFVSYDNISVQCFAFFTYFPNMFFLISFHLHIYIFGKFSYSDLNIIWVYWVSASPLVLDLTNFFCSQYSPSPAAATRPRPSSPPWGCWSGWPSQHYKTQNKYFLTDTTVVRLSEYWFTAADIVRGPVSPAPSVASRVPEPERVATKWLQL